MMYTEIPQKKIYLQILEQIKYNIVTKQLKSGDRLPSERQLSEQLGVSRATVREAIRALEMIGLVHCRQGEGNFITEDFDNTLTQPLSIMFWLNDGKVTEIHELRRSLETEAAKLAAIHATREDILRLEEICAAIESEPNEAKSAELDKKLHDSIALYSRNKLIKDVLNSASTLIEELIKDMRTLILMEEVSASAINRQHRDIVASIRKHDPDAAARAMLTHMSFIEDFVTEVQRAVDIKNTEEY
ncbi:MAG: HTH-type transcriptional regulator LutR [Eubacterium sp.]|uniref:FadR/GntR family transcriptional regulator n=1 Tax=Eubacterium sp. TaxID=142586 RepID=UPI003036D3E8